MSENIKTNFFSPEDLKTITQEMREERKSLNRLESLPYDINEVNPEELHMVRNIFQVLQRHVSDVIENVKTQTLEEKAAAYRESLAEIIKWMDGRDWAAKFSTSVRDDFEDLSEHGDDSLYYMTASGITIRLKRVMFDEGFDQIVRSPKEKCFFRERGSGIFLPQPKVGCYVEEFSSPEFIEAMEGNTDVVKSSLRLFKNSDGSYAGARSKGIRHPGHAVNRIFWSKF
jgi:hypothetical protein